MNYEEKVNSVFKDEQARRIVKSMLLDNRVRNVALGWMHQPPDVVDGCSLYNESTLRAWQVKLTKN